MSKRGKVRKAIGKRNLEDAPAVLVICTGKKCAPRDETRALVEECKLYAADHDPVVVTTTGCLDVCKKGPIAATFPKIRVKKKVSLDKAKAMIDKLEKRADKASAHEQARVDAASGFRPPDEAAVVIDHA